MNAINIKDLSINRETYTFIYRDKIINPTRKEFELLFLLASNPYRVYTRAEIAKLVWGQDLYEFNDRTIDIHIRKLRVKLNEEFIITIKGVGYKLLNQPE